MNERVRAEFAMLKVRYPAASLVEQTGCVQIPEFPLPEGRFNKSATNLVFMVPTGYPNTGPDNFAVDGDLKLRDGGNPPAFNGGPNTSCWVVPVPGNWGWFSWHPQGWRPNASIEAGDNLVGFVRSISLCLRGEESA